jgi:protoporphyrinogen/coproporphyrinogen III oxidase
VIRTPSDAPAAKNRYLHLPGINGLKMLPSSLTGLLSSGMAPLLVSAVLRDLITWSNLPSNIDDESVHSFLSRRFGSKFARIFGSALVHGIYAADSRILSVRAAFPSLWDAHLRGGGSVARSMFRRSTQKVQEKSTENDYILGGMADFMKNISVFSFKCGVSEIPLALSGFLRDAPNVELVHDPVLSISANDSLPNLSVS